MPPVPAALLLLLLLVGCRGEVRREVPARDRLARMVDSLRPPVERAVGLRFTGPVRSAMRTRDQVRGYLVRKLDEELPPRKLRGIETAYRLLGLIPDSLKLRGLLLDLYAEQVAGYYDPDSATLFGVAGADPAQLRLVLAHEMVHALQGQHLALDSILRASGDNDRLAAAQAILEGQATLASIEVLAPGQAVIRSPEFWQLYRRQVREQQGTMPVFARAPLVVRQALIFPYLEGAEFMRWWGQSPRADTVPYGPRMPTSTEQILHPERYARGDAPIAVALPADSTALHEDVLGENEIRVLLARLAGRDELDDARPLGWGGDRYRIYDAPGGPALVWYVAWDDAAARAGFLRRTRGRLDRTGRPGYRAELGEAEVAGRPGTRFVLAPVGWERWRSLLP